MSAVDAQRVRPMLEVRGLCIAYNTAAGPLPAVSDVDLTVDRGEVLGLIGESGCGKSTLGRALLGLMSPNAEVTGGSVLLDGVDVLRLDTRSLRRLRRAKVAMVFQDALSGLNPVHRIWRQVLEAFPEEELRGRSRAARRALAQQALEAVGLPRPGELLDAYPHQLSGGMKQRVLIGMAVAGGCELLIADEPTTALDVTTQAKILDLFGQLGADRGLGILFITHDVGVAAKLAARIGVMYAGRLVEQGDARRLLADPTHPYTRALLGSIPMAHWTEGRLAGSGVRTSAAGGWTDGCAYADRCRARHDVDGDLCQERRPALVATAAGDAVRCFRESLEHE